MGYQHNCCKIKAWESKRQYKPEVDDTASSEVAEGTGEDVALSTMDSAVGAALGVTEERETEAVEVTSSTSEEITDAVSCAEEETTDVKDDKVSEACETRWDDVVSDEVVASNDSDSTVASGINDETEDDAGTEGLGTNDEELDEERVRPDR